VFFFKISGNGREMGKDLRKEIVIIIIRNLALEKSGKRE
jgi:hypothetical protein